MKLDTHKQFVTLEGKALGVFAAQTKSGRWQYRSESGKIIASGMTPAQFVKAFWYRDDFAGGA